MDMPDKYYKYSAPSISLLKKWLTEFRFGVAPTYSVLVSGPFPILGRTMDSPQHFRDQAAIETLGFSKLTTKKLKVSLSSNEFI